MIFMIKKDSVKKFVSWNVNGIRAVAKKNLSKIINDLDAHIFAVQETKSQRAQLTDDIAKISGYYSYWFDSVKKGYSGVGVYCKEKPKEIIYGIENKNFDNEGRTITLEYDDYFFVNCYFPNAQHELTRLEYKLEFNKEFHKFIDKLAKQKMTVICGDFNVAHKPIDLANPEKNRKNPGFTEQECNWFDEFIKSGYIDTFRKFNQEPGNYTWWSYKFNAREKNIGWRIDYFFVDSKNADKVISAEILKDIYGSDHCPVSVKIKL